MRYENDGSVIFSAFQSDAIYLHNATDFDKELIRVMSTPKPETFLDRITQTISPSVNYRFIVGDEKQQVLADKNNHIVEMTGPGVAHICFIDEQTGEITNGIDAKLNPPRQVASSTDYDGIDLKVVSDFKLLRNAQNIGILVMPEDPDLRHGNSCPEIEPPVFGEN